MSGATIVSQGVTDEEGRLALGSVPLGEYRLVETEAPQGYPKPDAPILVLVSEASVSATQGASPSSVTHDDETDTWLISVWNTSGYTLPSTGGGGTGRYTMAGLALICAAVMLLQRKKAY